MGETNYMALGPVLEMVEQRRAELEDELELLKMLSLCDWNGTYDTVGQLFIIKFIPMNKKDKDANITIRRNRCKKRTVSDCTEYVENYTKYRIVINGDYAAVYISRDGLDCLRPLIMTCSRAKALIKFIDRELSRAEI